MTTVVTVVAYKLPLGDCNVFKQAPDGDHDVDVDGNLNPGTIIGYEHGTYTSIDVKGLRGTAANPIKLIPLADTGRLVNYQSGSGDLNFRNNQHVDFDGSGVPGETYGFVLGDRLHWYDNQPAHATEHITTQYIKIEHDLNKNGMKVTNNSAVRRITDIEIHHCWARTTDGEPFYIGTSWWDDHPGEQEIGRVNIHHNIARESNAGIELKACLEDGQIHHNELYDIDTASGAATESAIGFDQGTTGKIYNNIIEDCEGNGIHTFSDRAGQEIYNNLVINCGHADPVYNDGIRVGQNCQAANILIYNNTIITAEDYGIDISGGATNTEVYNNIILDCGTGSIDQGGSPGGNFHDNDTQEGYTIANYGFVDGPGGDFHLTAGSNGVDAGALPAPATDLDDNPRDALTPDIGCYEYQEP